MMLCWRAEVHRNRLDMGNVASLGVKLGGDELVMRLGDGLEWSGGASGDEELELWVVCKRGCVRRYIEMRRWLNCSSGLVLDSDEGGGLPLPYS
ncbi:hypothetical protein Tco_0067612 [Tanacetum coccineum]